MELRLSLRDVIIENVFTTHIWALSKFPRVVEDVSVPHVGIMREEDTSGELEPIARRHTLDQVEMLSSLVTKVGKKQKDGRESKKKREILEVRRRGLAEGRSCRGAVRQKHGKINPCSPKRTMKNKTKNENKNNVKKTKTHTHN